MQKLSREKLLRECETVLPGISPRKIIEQSGCFIFKDGRVHTYNDEVFYSQTTDLELEGAVDAEPFVNILRKLDEEEINISTDDAHIIIRDERTKKRRRAGVTLQDKIILPIEKIPSPKKWHPLPRSFGEAVSVASLCVSTNVTQFITVCIHLTKDFIEAFDNTQMVRYPLPLKLKEDALVRGASLRPLVDFDITKMGRTASWLHFRNDTGLVAACRTQKEEYIDLSEPMNFKGKAVQLPKGLVSAVDRAEVFSESNEENNQVEVTLKPGACRVCGRGMFGWYEERAKAIYKGPHVSFRMEPNILRDVISKHGKCTIAPGRMKAETQGYTYVTVLNTTKD